MKGIEKFMTVHENVPRVCACGATWRGLSFTAPPSDGSAVRGKCDPCIDREKAKLKEQADRAKKQAQEVITLADLPQPEPSGWNGYE